MPNVIPPRVSASPPPFDSVEDDKEEDEDFGAFTTGDTPVNNELLESSHHETSWNPNAANMLCVPPCHSPVPAVNTSGNESAQELPELSGHSDKLKTVNYDSEEDESVRAMIVPDIPIADDGDLYESKFNDSKVGSEFECVSTKPTHVLLEDLTEFKESSLGETCFESDEKALFVSEEKHTSLRQNEPSSSLDVSVNHLQCEKYSSDDTYPESDFSEFADFTQAEASFTKFETQKEWASQVPLKSEEATECDDFNDFKSAEFQVTVTEHDCPTENVKGFEFYKVIPQLDSIFKEVFPAGEVESGSEVSGAAVEVGDSLVWQGLRDLEATPSLSFQWAGSHSNRALLGSLNIDSRNILFGPKWNTVVPRFAANLGFSPLEPVRAVPSEPQLDAINRLPSCSVGGAVPAVPAAPAVSAAQFEAINKLPSCSVGFQGALPALPAVPAVPAAQFDWSDSGLVNPLDCSKAALATTLTSGNPALVSSSANVIDIQDSKLSPEATRILDSLPELAFLSARMLMFPVQNDSSFHKL